MGQCCARELDADARGIGISIIPQTPIIPQSPRKLDRCLFVCRPEKLRVDAHAHAVFTVLDVPLCCHGFKGPGVRGKVRRACLCVAVPELWHPLPTNA